jgi:DivIVA domain-containing protein
VWAPSTGAPGAQRGTIAGVYVVFVLLAAVLAFAFALVAAGRGGVLPPVEADRPGPVLPPGPVSPGDVHDVRFAVAVRGYRMDQVDAVLERLADEIAERDVLLGRLHADREDGPQGSPGDPGR